MGLPQPLAIIQGIGQVSSSLTDRPGRHTGHNGEGRNVVGYHGAGRHYGSLA